MRKNSMGQPKYIQIMNDIKDNITNGVLVADQKISTERELMEKYQVSRIVVINALNLLAESGYIYRIQGKGSFVASQPSESPIGPLGTEQVETPRTINLIMQTFDDDFSYELTKYILENTFYRNIYCMPFFTHLTEIDNEMAKVVENTSLKAALQNGTDAIILFPSEQQIYVEEILHLTNINFPVVLLDREMIGTGFPCVQSDHFGIGHMATEKLIAAGHKKIAFCSAERPDVILTIDQRKNGYIAALGENDIPANPNYVFTSLERNLNCDRLREKIINHEITAFVCSTAITWSILHGIVSELGVADDFSYICVDRPNINAGCSYILQDTKAIADAVVNEIVERCRSKKSGRETIKIPAKFVDMGTIKTIN